MNLLGNLFQSETMQKAAFGLLKKQMVDNDIKYIVVKLDENGNIAPDLFKATDQPVIMSQVKMDQIMEILKEQEATIRNQERHIRTIEDKLSETMINLNECRKDLNSELNTIINNDSDSNNSDDQRQPV